MVYHSFLEEKWLMSYEGAKRSGAFVGRDGTALKACIYEWERVGGCNYLMY